MRRVAPAPRIRTAPRVTRRCSADNGQERRLDHHFDDQPWTKAEALRSLAVKQRYLNLPFRRFGVLHALSSNTAHTIRPDRHWQQLYIRVSFLVRCPL